MQYRPHCHKSLIPYSVFRIPYSSLSSSVCVVPLLQSTTQVLYPPLQAINTTEIKKYKRLYSPTPLVDPLGSYSAHVYMDHADANELARFKIKSYDRNDDGLARTIITVTLQRVRPPEFTDGKTCPGGAGDPHNRCYIEPMLAVANAGVRMEVIQSTMATNGFEEMNDAIRRNVDGTRRKKHVGK